MRKHPNSTRVPTVSLARSRSAQKAAVKRSAAHRVATGVGHLGRRSAGTSGGNPTGSRVELGTGQIGKASAGTSGGRKRARVRVVRTEPKGTSGAPW